MFVSFVKYATGMSAIATMIGVLFSELLDLKGGQIGMLLLGIQLLGIPGITSQSYYYFAFIDIHPGLHRNAHHWYLHIGAFMFHRVGGRIGFSRTLAILYFGWAFTLVLMYFVIIDSHSRPWLLLIVPVFGILAGGSLSQARYSFMLGTTQLKAASIHAHYTHY